MPLQGQFTSITDEAAMGLGVRRFVLPIISITHPRHTMCKQVKRKFSSTASLSQWEHPQRMRPELAMSDVSDISMVRTEAGASGWGGSVE